MCLPFSRFEHIYQPRNVKRGSREPPMVLRTVKEALGSLSGCTMPPYLPSVHPTTPWVHPPCLPCTSGARRHTGGTAAPKRPCLGFPRSPVGRFFQNLLVGASYGLPWVHKVDKCVEKPQGEPQERGISHPGTPPWYTLLPSSVVYTPPSSLPVCTGPSVTEHEPPLRTRG